MSKIQQAWKIRSWSWISLVELNIPIDPDVSYVLHVLANMASVVAGKAGSQAADKNKYEAEEDTQQRWGSQLRIEISLAKHKHP